MGQEGDYLPICSKTSTPVSHLEGFSMGAGMAAHVAARYIRDQKSFKENFKPISLLSCSGFTRGKDVIKGAPAATHPLLKGLQVIPFYETTSWLIAKLLFFRSEFDEKLLK